MINGFKWIGLIIATMVGAGYASGREIWEFFGLGSSLAIVLFTIMFIVSCQVILEVSYLKKSEHYKPVLEQFLGVKSAKVYDYLVMVYLFTTLFVMIAGSGATVTIFEWSNVIGILLMVILLLVIIPRGMDGVLSINRFLLPLLIVGLFLVLMIFVFQERVSFLYGIRDQSNWVQAIPFTSLNVLPLIAVLSAVGKEIKTKKEIYVASIGSGLILGTISMVYNMSLISVAEQLYFYEIPLFAILNGYPFEMFLLMAVLLWFAIYTTALTSLFGIIARLQELFKQLSTGKIGLCVLLIALPFSFFSFSNLVSYLYPLYGVLNLYVLGAILLFPIVKRATTYKI
ncbi:MULTISPECIES: hypothetical protein [Allobacillus]|uniref:Uncharacterized protein n=1 Tax=Allobacillus salarius TaxID=1955272 RepID=A0A556PG96_9BACI|nr:hypothetical protein [Allobacillus salarius]TSJ63416.1 hypothetical protein FPQ13_09440 [Allobacillus salarius]